MKRWTITNSKGRVKKSAETKSHKEYLYKFKSAVDASRKHEIDARLGINTASISVVTGAITAVSGVGAAIAVISALGGTTAAGYSIWYSIEEKREADRYFAIL